MMFEVGDRVAYSAAFLEAVQPQAMPGGYGHRAGFVGGCSVGPLASLRGEVTAVGAVSGCPHLLTLRWDGETIERNVNRANLSRAGFEALSKDQRQWSDAAALRMAEATSKERRPLHRAATHPEMGDGNGWSPRPSPLAWRS